MDDLPKAKRLRGHFLELEKRKGNTLTKGQAKSGLVNKLLSLWAHGQLSATLCQQIAHLALLDGAQSEELSLMASMGNWGQACGNCHRDFLSHFNKENGLTKAFELQVPVRDPKTSKAGTETASLFSTTCPFCRPSNCLPRAISKAICNQPM